MIAHADHEADEGAIALCHAEVFGGVEEMTQAGLVERQDRGAGGIVEGKDGIQLVLAHVADDNRHSNGSGSGVRGGGRHGGRKIIARAPEPGEVGGGDSGWPGIPTISAKWRHP